MGLAYLALVNTFEVLVVLAIALRAGAPAGHAARAGCASAARRVLILLWIATLMISDLLADAARVPAAPRGPRARAAPTWRRRWPGHRWRACRRAPLLVLHQAAFWAHVVLVLAFLNYLPYGKHFHVLTALPAVFLGKLEPYALPADDGVRGDGARKESFGVGQVEEYLLAAAPGHVHLHRVRPLQRGLPDRT